MAVHAQILQQAGSQIDYIALHIYPFYDVTYEKYASAQEATSGYSSGWNFQARPLSFPITVAYRIKTR